MKIYIGESKLHGKGLLASRNIKKGETIFIIRGKKVKFLINNKRQANLAGLNWVGWGKNTWIDPAKYCIYFNHSCNPNSALRKKVTVIALRDIKKDEEVTFDYSLNEGDIFWHMKCNCGSKNCRGIIRSIQFLPKKIFNKRKKYVPKYFQKIFKEFNVNRFDNSIELRTTWVNFIKKGFSV